VIFGRLISYTNQTTSEKIGIGHSWCTCLFTKSLLFADLAVLYCI
jgi:hypothetical protein